MDTTNQRAAKRVRPLHAERLEARRLLDGNLIVTAFSPTASGFVAEFNEPLQAGLLNLYDSAAAGHGRADVEVRNSAGSFVRGSLVIDPTAQRVTFLRTGGPLPNDHYSVTLRSAVNGFRSVAGNVLDGDRDGISADDFHASFTIEANQDGAIVVGVPDFVRGPGQSIELTAEASSGVPLVLSDAGAVRQVELEIHFDTRLFSVNDIRLGSAMPEGSELVTTELAPGAVLLQVTAPFPLSGGDFEFAIVHAEVPASAMESYGDAGILALRNLHVRDFFGQPLSAVADDALQVTTYVADVTANGRVNGSDASQIARYAALLDTGFGSLAAFDPILLADVSGNSRVNAADATWAALIGAGFDLPGVPQKPALFIQAEAAATSIVPAWSPAEQRTPGEPEGDVWLVEQAEPGSRWVSAQPVRLTGLDSAVLLCPATEIHLVSRWLP